MLLQPIKSKFTKSFTSKKITSNSKNKIKKLNQSKFALIASEAGYIPNYQMQAIRLFLRRTLKKRAQIFIKFFPNRPITKKPNEVRLGRGKGNTKY